MPRRTTDKSSWGGYIVGLIGGLVLLVICYFIMEYVSYWALLIGFNEWSRIIGVVVGILVYVCVMLVLYLIYLREGKKKTHILVIS